MKTGEKIAMAVFLVYTGECGPFGGEDPILKGNKVTLYSQVGKSTYTFHDDGTIYAQHDYEVIDEEHCCDDYEYDNFDALIRDDSWFYDFNDGLTIREILESLR